MIKVILSTSVIWAQFYELMSHITYCCSRHVAKCYKSQILRLQRKLFDVGQTCLEMVNINDAVVFVYFICVRLHTLSLLTCSPTDITSRIVRQLQPRQTISDSEIPWPREKLQFVALGTAKVSCKYQYTWFSDVANAFVFFMVDVHSRNYICNT
jgi:hypothetical protein